MDGDVVMEFLKGVEVKNTEIGEVISQTVLETLGIEDMRQRESEEENVECDPEIANPEAASRYLSGSDRSQCLPLEQLD